MKTCKKHGELNESNSYTENCSKGYGLRIRCRQCKLEKDERYRKNNRKDLVVKNMEYKKNNRDIVNKWNKEDRKLNPEKYKRYEQNYIKKHGIEKIRLMEVLRIHGLTKDQYETMIFSQNNKCAICKESETRMGRSGEIAQLCIDHCHKSEANGIYKIRGLLCHSCNTGIGKFRDNIDLLKSAITYLEKHL
jgi:hypothetical protein